MRISVFYDHLKEIYEKSNMDMQSILNKAKSLNIEGIEIKLEYLLEENKIIDNIKQAQMCISSIYEFYNWDRNNDMSIAYKHLYIAQKYNVNKVLVIPGFLTKEESKIMMHYNNNYKKLEKYMDRNKKIQNMVKCLTIMVSEANKMNIDVMLENYDSEIAPYSTKYQLMYFVKKVKGLRIVIDSGNFIYVNDNVLESYELLKDFIIHFHCKDRKIETENNNKFKICSVGKGDIPIKEVIKALYTNNYDDFITIEHYDVQNQMKSIKQSVSYIIDSLSLVKSK